MELQQRIRVLVALGEYLRSNDERLQAHIHRASVDNPWFTQEFIGHAIDQISSKMLEERALTEWSKDVVEPAKQKNVGIIMAGNIPAVGFHDFLCVFISGHKSLIKLSEKDKYLIPFFLKIMGEKDARVEEYYSLVDKLSGMDAVIATGSNNSARYFESYFSQYPHIIRRNRNAIAVLDGNETIEELFGLADDIFLYFGMGCRSVSMAYLPTGYNFADLISQLHRSEYLAQHSKYKNNLDYNLALQILNKTPHIALPHLLLIESNTLISPVSCLYYSTYDDLNELEKKLEVQLSDIQCIVARKPIGSLRTVPFGEAQSPGLTDYADGVDVLAFLQNL
jgi:hypothetical protein